jgi:MFS family permease
VAGGSFVKILMEKFTLHQILIGSIFVGGLSFMVSSLSLTFINLALSLFVGASCCCMINITCNVCTMRLFNRDRRPDFWIQILHTVFGVGGLIGPFFVSIFGSRSYFILGIVLAVSSVFFFFLTPPETGPDRKSEIARPINRKAEIAICALYVLYIGQ